MNSKNITNEELVEEFDIVEQTPTVDENRILGKFELVGIPPSVRGVPQIDVEFEVDANGIVNVSAKDKMTGLEQAMQITPSSGLTPDEIERLIMDAEKSSDTDRKSKDIIMHRNKVTSSIENTRKAMHEFRKSIPPEELEEINQSLIKSEQELIEDDIEIIKIIYNEVEGTANKLSEKLMSVA
ncbi:MAG: Hsp70 family protein [Acidobacteriota bacterium]|jgi:molecular chaperone DnaK|nr:Hsp70 family protein [Acidobacteriota bacterium]